MATAYSRIVTVAAGARDGMAGIPPNPDGITGLAIIPAYVELPCAPRGVIESLVVTQLSGTTTDATVNIYDRAWATGQGFDLNVDDSLNFKNIWINAPTGSGSTGYWSCPNYGPGAPELIAAAPPGTRLLFKCPSWIFERTWTEVEVIDWALPSLEMRFQPVVGTIDDHHKQGGYPMYSAGTAQFQAVPYMAPGGQASHLVYTGSVSSGSLQAFNMDIGYENRDNQSETKRTRHAGLWLDIIADEVSTWEIAITTESDGII
jgi:hypothetical protein